MSGDRPVPTALLAPRRVAVIGASAGASDPWSFNARLTRAVLGSRLESVVLVSRSTEEIAGRPTVPTIRAADGPVDVAVVAVPGPAVADTIEECLDVGVAGCVVISAGIPVDDRARIRARCAEAEVRLLGPNCVGFVDAGAGVALFAGGTPPRLDGAGPEVAVITQSGGFASSIIAAGEQVGLRFGHVFSTGDELDVGLEDCLAHVLDAGRSAVIVCFVEAIRDPVRFRRLARRAAHAAVPLCVLRIGRTAVARTVALAHSGALVDDWAATAAALEDDGVITCRSLHDVLDTAVVATAANRDIGPDLDVVSSSGALGALTADLAAEHGLTLRGPEQSLGARVAAAGSDDAHTVLVNPLDTATTGGSVATVRALAEAARADTGAVGSALLFGHSGATYADVLGPALADLGAALRSGDGILVACWPGAPDAAGEVLRVAGVAVVPDPDRALGALGRLARWSRRRATVAPESEPVVGAAGPSGPGVLVGYAASRALLASWGLPAPRHVTIGGADDLAAGALDLTSLLTALKAPFAVKGADGPNHKAAAGGVVLGVADATGVAAAIARFRAGGQAGAVVVEEMVDAGVEVLVAMRRTVFGDLMTLGWGGSATEDIADVATLSAPCTPARVEAALARTRVGRWLDRAVPSTARAALVHLCGRLADRFAADPGVREVECNPVIVNAHGAYAADARVVVAGSPAAASDAELGDASGAEGATP